MAFPTVFSGVHDFVLWYVLWFRDGSLGEDGSSLSFIQSCHVIFFNFLFDVSCLSWPRALNFKVPVLHSLHLRLSEVKTKAGKLKTLMCNLESQDFPTILSVL